MFDFNSKPDFINDKGYKFWLDKDLTKYAQEKNLKGTKLKDLFVYFVEIKNGYRTRLLINNKTGEILKEGTALEDIVCFIDFLKLQKEFDEKD